MGRDRSRPWQVSPIRTVCNCGRARRSWRAGDKAGRQAPEAFGQSGLQPLRPRRIQILHRRPPQPTRLRHRERPRSPSRFPAAGRPRGRSSPARHGRPESWLAPRGWPDRQGSTDLAVSRAPASMTTKRTPAAPSRRVSGPLADTIRFSRIDAELSGGNDVRPTSSPSSRDDLARQQLVPRVVDSLAAVPRVTTICAPGQEQDASALRAGVDDLPGG